jgi:FMN phosphatase YigB (HAD superfamily)
MSHTLNARGGVQTPISSETTMNLTLLLDLDDTLLDTDLNAFLPAYFQALTGFMADRIAPDSMLSALMAGTRKMIANNDPSRTLQQVFDAEFFPLLSVDRNTYLPFFDQFYEEIFPTLQHLTNPKPEAVAMVEWAVTQEVRLAVATNPLFPLKAIHHRMRWAGLPPEIFPFEVVSAYEDFHFAKPNPAYFAEVLGRMGWPDGSVLMVGDDTERDMPGACKLGLPTFWVSDPARLTTDSLKPTGQGSIGDLRGWLGRADLSTLEPAHSTPESLMAVMLSTPAVISGLLRPATSPNLTRRPVSGEWSLTEVVCHLRDTEGEVNYPRLHMLLELDEPFIPARMTAAWAEERDYNNQDFSQALQDFITARVQTLDLLRGLKDEWQRKARHAIFGPTDLQEMVKFIVEHDKLHIRQIKTTLEQISG